MYFNILISICPLLSPSESEGDIPQHVMVLCSGHVFILTVTDDYKEQLSPPELQKQLQYIRDTCDQQPKGPSVGILTAHNRSTWAEVSFFGGGGGSSAN